MDEVDCVVIGAGVIGLAVARALALRRRTVIILERERHFGMHMSSRNSEVIHAGIHYAPGSIKARTCVSGRELLYGYCRERGIAHRRCGKFIVATAEVQLAQLHAIESQARANGVFDLEWLDGPQAKRCEPALACEAALWSPSTGIIDSHGLMLSLLADAEARDARIAYGAAVTALKPTTERGRCLHRVRAAAGVAGASHRQLRGPRCPESRALDRRIPGTTHPRCALCQGQLLCIDGDRTIQPLDLPGAGVRAASAFT